MTRVGRLVVVVTLLGACGRIGFDAAGDAPRSGDAPLAPVDAFVPPTCAGGCSASEFCATDDGDCGGTPSCRPIPSSCPILDNPVCGCNGTSFMNPCEANLAKMSMASSGNCLLNTNPVCTPACDATQYCFTPVGVCAQQPGTCLPKPMVTDCDLLVSVCACDGSTYTSECEAAIAGMSLRSGDSCTF